MKLIYASNIAFTTPNEADFAELAAAFEKLLKPLAVQLGVKFMVRIRSRLKLQTIPKNCLLQEENEVAAGVYFLLIGSVLVGTDLIEDGQVDQILRGGDFILPGRFFSGGRTLAGMKAATPSRLLFMDSRSYMRLLKKFPQAVMLTNLWRDKLEEDDFVRKRKMEVMNATERLSWLYDKWPDCFMAFNDHWIGSYLGLTRETVCRLKLNVIKRGGRSSEM